MDRQRLVIAGMWLAAIAAMVAIYLKLEPAPGDGRTRLAGDAPTYAVEDRAPAAERAGLAVAEDEGAPSHYRGGPRHTGRSPHRGPARAELAFRYHAGSRITAQPIVADDGTIYLGTHGRELHAVTAEGERRWTAPVHDRVWSAAAVDGDVVYVGSDAGALFAFGASDGALRWRLRGEGDVDGPVTVAPDGLYFTSGSHLYAASAEGEVRWRFRARGAFVLSAPAVDSDGTVYVSSIDDHVYAIAPDGRMRWAYATGDDVSSSPVIGDDGTIYVGSDDQKVHAITRDGRRRWAVSVDGFVRAPVALGRRGDVVAGVYGPQPRVVSLDAQTGGLRWYFPVTVSGSSETGIASGPLVDADGHLYFGAQDDYVYSITADGALRWIHRTGADVDSAPVISPEGLLLIGCDDGYLYAFRDAGPASSDAGPAPDGGPAAEE